MRKALPLFLAGVLMAACGQRGALYLPGEQREDVGAAGPAAAPSPPAAPVASPIPAQATDPESESNRRNRTN